MAYDLFCKSVQGAGHIKRGIPREDHGVKREAALCKVFALGDGHGDSNCPRSAAGSQYVCEIAAEELVTFAGDMAEHGWNRRLFNRSEADRLITQLVTSIFGKWSCRVNDDFHQNPLTEQEEAEATAYIEAYRRGERIEHIYGTTFIAGLVTEEYLLLLQQGDGRCVVFNQDGSASQPIPWDDRCFANVTTSVCDIDAVQSCRYHVVDLSQNRVIACVAGSDGVEDSFPGSMDKMHAYYRSILKIACEEGVEALENHLDRTLPSLSENGSHDDITICGVVDAELLAEKLDRMELEDQMITLRDTISSAQERIKSMTDKLNFLQGKYENVLQEYAEVSDRHSAFMEEYTSIRQDVALCEQDDTAGEEVADSEKALVADTAEDSDTAKKKSLSPSSLQCLQERLEQMTRVKERLDAELEKADSKKHAVEEEYLPYKEKYDDFLKAKEDAQIRLDELMG